MIESVPPLSLSEGEIMENSYNKIIVTRDKIFVSRIFESKFQKGNTLTAELKQTVHSSITYPPKKSVANKVLDNPFLNEESVGKTFTRSKTFVAFLDVDEDLSIEDAQKVIDNYPNAIIYKILSNHPILTSSQRLALDSMEDKELRQQRYDLIANRQLIVKKGRIILDSFGKPQYLATFYSNDFKEDEDHRNSNPEDYYKNKYVETHLNLLEFGDKNVLL